MTLRKVHALVTDPVAGWLAGYMNSLHRAIRCDVIVIKINLHM